MPYVPWNTKTILWDGSGKPYWQETNGTRRMYLPPITVSEYRDDPKAVAWAAANGVTAENPSGNVPGGGLLHHRGVWNDDTGKYDTPIDWGNVLSIAVGTALTAGAASAIGGGAAAGAGTGGAYAGDLGAVNATLDSLGAAGAGAGGGAAAGGLTAQGLIRYGVPTAGNIVGNVLQARAEGKAADVNADYLNRALEAAKEEQQYRRTFDEEARGYNRGQRADYLGRLQPYGDAGTAATGRASALLTTSRYRPELAAAPQGRGIQMRAPDGSMQEVPETLVDHYQQLGAVRV